MLYRTTFLENWGSGAGRIIDACRKAGVAEPIWKTEGGFVIVTFPRPNGTQDGTQGGTQDVNLDIWIENQLILRPKITTEELSLLSGKSIVTIKRHIAKMPHIKYEGSGYSGHWVVLKK